MGLEFIISILFFALAVSVKGGLLGNIFKNWDRLVHTYEQLFKAHMEVIRLEWQAKNYVEVVKTIPYFLLYTFLKWFVDGSVISLFMVLIFTLFDLPWENALLFTAAWILIWRSMGEEASAAGDYVEAWGPYIEASIPKVGGDKFPFGRSYGIKKGIDYGGMVGAGFALAVGSWSLWLAAATFPLCYFLGNSLYRWHHKGAKRGWSYSEPLWGAIIGIGYVFAKLGYLPVRSAFTF